MIACSKKYLHKLRVFELKQWSNLGKRGLLKDIKDTAHSRIEDALLVQPVSKIILISQNHPGIILVFIFQEYIFPQHKNRFS